VKIIKKKDSELVTNVNTPLYLKVSRLIAKCQKKGYEFSDLELAMFQAMGREEWQENRINWLVIELFERLYAKFYP
jgi:hypothetical protein